MQLIYRFHHWQKELERTAWASWLKAGRTPGHYRPYFWRIKKSSRSTEGNVFPLFASPYPLGNASDRSPTARGTVGEKTAMLNRFPLTVLPLGLVLSADISPPPLSEILFLRRFEQEEVGRWSLQKRQACGPLTTSCSLFCDTKTVPRSVLGAAVSPVCHSRRRNPVFQVWNAPARSLGQGTTMIIAILVLSPGGRHLMQQF